MKTNDFTTEEIKYLMNLNRDFFKNNKKAVYSFLEFCKYIDVTDIYDIEVITKGRDYFEFKYGREEYLVFKNYDSAYKYAKNYIREMIDVEGYYLFNEDFLESCIDEEYLIKELIDSEYDMIYSDDSLSEREQERMFNEVEKQIKRDPIEYLEGIYGRNWKKEIDIEKYIDEDKLIEEAIDVDGIGHFLAIYDGEELNFGDLLIYRIN